MVLLSAPLIDALQSVVQRGVEPRHNIAQNDRVIFQKFRQQHHIYYLLFVDFTCAGTGLLRVQKMWESIATIFLGRFIKELLMILLLLVCS